PDTRHARLAEIDREIALLQAERDALVNSLKFPIISLPVEITSQIFLHCIPGDPLSPGSFYPAVVLGHVCRQWREIALAVPDLWSSWSLAIDGNISRKRLLTGLNLWLARSQTRPLSLRLHHRDGAGPDVSPQDEHWWEVATDFDVAMLPAIVPHHRRWENVELNIPLTIVHNLAKVVPVDGLPNLTHLLLGSSQEDWVAYTDDQGPITLFADAPQLRSLHLVLEAQNNLDRMDHVELPYDQLTHFTGTLFGALECLTLLAKTPLLVECVFYMGTRVPTVNVHASTLPHLKSLKLFASAPNVHPAIVLEHLTLPALDTLVLGREELAMPHVLSSFVLRSQCTIRHFSCQAMDREELVECLQAMPLL
ncbi:hypothetical protein C8R47DRAFT_942892, partial [Mycena vitilis]